MKTILLVAALSFASASCVTTKTTVTDPNGTVTVTEVTAPAPGAVDSGAVIFKGIVDERSSK